MTKRYNEYKDSGIEWLGETPNHWNVSKIKNKIKKSVGGFWGKDPLGNKNENLIPALRVNNFNKEKLIIESNDLKIRNIKHDEFKIRKVLYNDLLIERSGGGEHNPVGNVVIFKENYDVTFNEFIKLLRVDKTMSPDYLKYYFNFLYNIRLNMLSIKQSTGLQNINIPNYLRNSFSYPPEKTEQQAIADYLDNKTSKIDSALAELTKQKSLLIELKKSTIHQAVTKGLDPTVPMKDSGHEWIGEIPEGWQVKNIKEYFKFSMGNIILKEDLNESKKGIPVYSATAEDKFFGYVNNANLILNKDDLVIPARGNSIGFVKIVKGISTATQTTIAAKSNKKINSKFVYYYLTGLKSEIFKFDNTAIPQYTVETAKTIKTCIPKNEEQTEIVEYLDIKIGQINQSIKVIDNQITKMKKYKKTLINYVVTGKIKVID